MKCPKKLDIQGVKIVKVDFHRVVTIKNWISKD